MKMLRNVTFVIQLWIYSFVCEAYTFNLCAYFIKGGTCEEKCKHEARHSWGIPLCMHTGATGSHCCIPPGHPLLAHFESQTTTTPLKTTTTPIKETFECGISNRHSRVRRVVGGSTAPPGSWPWQVAVRLYTGQYVCGGVIVSDRWILSAAHCFDKYVTEPDYLRVYAGDQKLSYGKQRRNMTKAIKRIVIHENFKSNVPTVVKDPVSGEVSFIYRHMHDIALLELNETLSFSSTMRPVCLPDTEGEAWNEAERSENCWVYGWGESNDVEQTEVSDLQEVKGSVLTAEECSKKWGTDLTQDTVCFSSSGRGPCSGDSGGGLSCQLGDGRSYLMGIISWGRDDCKHDDHPSVQTRVESYMDWINSYIEE